MKLSIITPIYKQSKSLKSFLSDLMKQEFQNFELVLVVDTNTEKVLEIIDEFKINLKCKISIIYNSSRIGRSKAISKGVMKSKGDYIIVASTSNVFYKSATKELVSLIDSKKTDVIEFRARVREPFKYIGKMRKVFSSPTNIKENPEVIAHTQPFDFNKLIKSDVAKQSASLFQIYPVNNRYSIGYLTRVFLNAKTYSNTNTKIIRSVDPGEPKGNSIDIIKQWNAIFNYYDSTLESDNIKYSEEFEYLSFFHIATIASLLISKTSLLISKKSAAVISQKFNKLFEEMKDKQLKNIFSNNKYFKLESQESMIMKKVCSIKEMQKIHKEIE